MHLDFDEDDPLAGLLSDDDEPKKPEPKPVAKPASKPEESSLERCKYNHCNTSILKLGNSSKCGIHVSID